MKYLFLLVFPIWAFAQGLIEAPENHESGDPTTIKSITGTRVTDADGAQKRALDVNIPGLGNLMSFSAYGEQTVSQLKLVIQGQAYYRFIPSNFRSFTGGTGTSDASTGVLKVTSGTTVFGYGTIQSFRSLNYSAGEGSVIRFAARFPNPVAGTWSGVGGFTISDELSVGYNGTEFGVWHRYGGAPEVQTLTITGAAGGSENATVTVNGVAYTVPLTSGTVQKNAKEIADYLTANATLFNAEQLNDTVVVSFTSDGDKASTFSFTSSTATASFAETTAGVAKTFNHIPQSEFNGELFTGFDPSKGNVYQIIYQNGYGDMSFFVENPSTNRMQLMHRIKWSNNSTTENLTNPSLRPGVYAYSVGGTTSTTVEMPYIAGFAEGSKTQTRNTRAYSSTKSIGTTLTNIFTIRNKRIYQGRINQAEIEPKTLTLANDGSKSAIFEIRGNPTVAGNTNFQDIGTNLISEIDTAGTTVSSDGRLLFSIVLSKGSSAIVDLAKLNIIQPATLRLVVAAKMASGASSDLTASLNWLEDL